MKVSSFYKHISQSWKWFSLPKDLKCQSSFILEWLQGKKVIVLTSCSLFAKAISSINFILYLTNNKMFPESNCNSCLWSDEWLRSLSIFLALWVQGLSHGALSVMTNLSIFQSLIVHLHVFRQIDFDIVCWNMRWGSVLQYWQCKYCRETRKYCDKSITSIFTKVCNNSHDFIWTFGCFLDRTW